MFCENCGKQIEDSSAFCPGCGRQLKDGLAGGGYSPIQPLGNLNQMNSMQPSAYNGQPYPQQPVVQPASTVINVNSASAEDNKSLNGFCVASFALSIAGFFISALICGGAAVVFGIIGVATYDEFKHKGNWMGYTGIVLGIINCIIGIFLVSFFVELFSNI